MSHKCTGCQMKFNSAAQARCSRSTCPSKNTGTPLPADFLNQTLMLNTLDTSPASSCNDSQTTFTQGPDCNVS